MKKVIFEMSARSNRPCLQSRVYLVNPLTYLQTNPLFPNPVNTKKGDLKLGDTYLE